MDFSVIVPIYQVEPYLRQCVDSILGQTHQTLELILVDDGSPDGCPALCDEYAARDSRVTVIHKPNGGLVSARQAGLQAARGEYVVNVDGDDWIAPDFLAQAAALIQAHGVDVVTFGVTYVEETGTRVVREPVPEGVYDRARKEREILPKALMAPDMSHMFYYLCGKAIRRTLLYRHQMAVDQRISLGEDVTCLMPVYRAAERVCVSVSPAYFCRCRSGSDSRLFRVVQYQQFLVGLEALDAMGGGPEWEAQVDRYASFLSFALLEAMVAAGETGHFSTAQAYMNRPELRRHLAGARFRGVTPKMRVVYFLFRRNWTGVAMAFLSLCKAIKHIK